MPWLVIYHEIECCCSKIRHGARIRVIHFHLNWASWNCIHRRRSSLVRQFELFVTQWVVNRGKITVIAACVSNWSRRDNSCAVFIELGVSVDVQGAGGMHEAVETVHVWFCRRKAAFQHENRKKSVSQSRLRWFSERAFLACFQRPSTVLVCTPVSALTK